MQNDYAVLPYSSHLRSTTPWSVVASGLWLRAGFTGGCAVIGGLIVLVSGEMAPLTASAIVVAGSLVAKFSFGRAWTVLTQLDKENATSDSIASPSDLSLRAL